MTKQRLELYFKEATKHIDLIEESLDVLQETLKLEQKFNEIKKQRN